MADTTQASLIKLIAEDNRSGAAEILAQAAKAFSLLDIPEQNNIEQAQGKIIESCIALAQSQPDMAPLLNLSSAAITAAQMATRADEAVKAAASAAQSFFNKAAGAILAAISRAECLIPEGATILTHSRSTTVLSALTNAQERGKHFTVIATESRPVLEGRALAEVLSASRVRVILIADAAAAMVMDKVGLVLMGADKITPENLINKIGTRMIALAARERGVPVYAICDTSKFVACSRFGVSAGKRSAAELWPDAPEGVEVFNSYFEPTPLDYFTGIITEEGILQPQQARLRAEAAVIHKSLLNALGIK